MSLFGLAVVLCIAVSWLNSQADRRESARRQWEHEQRMRDRGEWPESGWE